MGHAEQSTGTDYNERALCMAMAMACMHGWSEPLFRLVRETCAARRQRQAAIDMRVAS